MEIKSIQVAMATVLVGVVASGLLISGSASAAVTSQSVAENAAYAAYANTMAKAKIDFLAVLKPSRAAALAAGARAEFVRRSRVKTALVAFNSVVLVAKAPSLADEKSYKVVVTKLAASPTNTSLKAAAKTSLLTLTTATAALKADSRVAVARVAFAKARTSAMAEFKSAVAITVQARAAMQARATSRYKVVKARALANLQVALKAAKKTK